VTLQDILVRPIDEAQAPGTGVFYGGGELAPAPEDLGEPVASAGDWSFYGCS
jgi:hypothetical protein